jgi:sugar fermentation stimulation protein A
MMIISNLFLGYFLERPNRFSVIFRTQREEEKAHLRDPGRLKELLIPGVRLLLRKALNPDSRKTKYDVIAVWSNGIWVLINSGFHSDLAAELLESHLVPEFLNYDVKKREFTFGKSRIDFLLSRGEEKMLLEVKGCTLVDKGLAKFPDAPTDRGKRHVEELISAKNKGMNSAVLFLITREDALVFAPNWVMDPAFAGTLSQAHQKEVKVIAYSFKNKFKRNKLEIKAFERVKINFKK